MGSDESRESGAPEISGLARVQDFVWEGQGPAKTLTRLGDMSDNHLEHALNCVRSWATKAEHRVEEMIERSGGRGRGDFEEMMRREEMMRMRMNPSEFEWRTMDRARWRGPPVDDIQILHETRKAKNWWEWERRFLAEIKRRRNGRDDFPSQSPFGAPEMDGIPPVGDDPPRKRKAPRD